MAEFESQEHIYAYFIITIISSSPKIFKIENKAINKLVL